MVSGSLACGPYFTNSGGTRAPSRTGYTNMLSGMSSWNRSLTRKSRNALPPSVFLALLSSPAYSTCRKQVPCATPVGAALGFGSA